MRKFGRKKNHPIRCLQFWTFKSFLAGADGCLVYQEGLGVGGLVVRMGKAKTMAECIKIALQKEPTTNGVTLSGTDCEARIGQLYVQDSDDCEQNCFINQKNTGGNFEIHKKVFQTFSKKFQRCFCVNGCN